MWRMIIFIGFISFSCSNQISNKNDASAWVKEYQKVLHKSKVVNKIKYDLTMLIPEYQAYMESGSKSEYDSLFSIYNNGFSFILKIGPDNEEKGGDIMMMDVYSENDYDKRYIDLNFNFSSYISMVIDSTEYKPMLHVMENTYGLTKSRKFNFVFSPTNFKHIKKDIKQFKIKIEDVFFKTGINYFSFDITEVPEFPEVIF